MTLQCKEPINPNTVTDDSPMTSEGVRPNIDASSKSCLHCGRLSAFHVFAEDDPGHKNPLFFCCAGCQCVYLFLKEKSLGRYYDILNQLGRTATTAADARLDLNVESESPLDTLRAFGFNEDSRRLTLYLPSMNCGACLWLLERVIKSESWVTWFRINLDDRLLHLALRPDLTLEESGQKMQLLLLKLKKIGYVPRSASDSLDQNRERIELKKKLIELGVAAAAFGNVMLFSSSVYLIQNQSDFSRYFNLWSALIASLSLVFAGRSIFVNAWSSLGHRSLHVDIPIAVALLASWLLSVWNLWHGSVNVYFDSVTGLVFLLLASRLVNERLTAKAKNFVQGSSDTQQSARLKDGFKKDDIIAIPTGSVIPADGFIVKDSIISGDDSRCEVSETFLTGESRSVSKKLGDKVLGGSINLGSRFSMTVTTDDGASWIDDVYRQLESTVSAPSPRESYLQTVAKGFVALTFVLSISSFFYWNSVLGLQRAFEVVAAILIVSCPCALATAIPLTTALAMGRAWRHGLVVKNRQFFEDLVACDTFVFDKTGTLTRSELAVTQSQIYEPSHNHLILKKDQLFGVLHAVTGHVPYHPVSRSLHLWSQCYPKQDVRIESVESFSGRGVLIHCCDQRQTNLVVRIGKSSWVKSFLQTSQSLSWDSEEQDNHEKHVLISFAYLNGNSAWSDLALVDVTLEEILQSEALDVLSELRARGLTVLMLTGDQRGPAMSIANQLGFSSQDIYSEATPFQKLEFLQKLIDAGHKVAMVGDGVNDAAVLKKAHLGLVLDHGVKTSVAVSDAVLSRGLSVLGDAVRYAKFHDQTVKLVLLLSFIYNGVAITYAVKGAVHPLMAALIMPLASLTTLLVALLRNRMFSWKSSTSSCPLPSSLQLSVS